MRCKNFLMRLLCVGMVMIGTVTLTLMPGTAHAGLDIDLLCPTTIVPGTALNLGLALEKESSAPFSTTFTKTALAIYIGNSSIVGPAAVPIAVTLTAATPISTPCGGPLEPACIYWDDASIPTYFSTVPKKLTRGTFIGVGVAVMDSTNNPLTEDHCIIEVL